MCSLASITLQSRETCAPIACNCSRFDLYGIRYQLPRHAVVQMNQILLNALPLERACQGGQRDDCLLPVLRLLRSPFFSSAMDDLKAGYDSCLCPDVCVAGAFVACNADIKTASPTLSNSHFTIAISGTFRRFSNEHKSTQGYKRSLSLRRSSVESSRLKIAKGTKCERTENAEDRISAKL